MKLSPTVHCGCEKNDSSDTTDIVELMQELHDAERDVDAILLEERNAETLIHNLKSIVEVVRKHGATESLIAAINEDHTLESFLGLDFDKFNDKTVLGTTLIDTIQTKLDSLEYDFVSECQLTVATEQLPSGVTDTIFGTKEQIEETIKAIQARTKELQEKHEKQRLEWFEKQKKAIAEAKAKGVKPEWEYTFATPEEANAAYNKYYKDASASWKKGIRPPPPPWEKPPEKQVISKVGSLGNWIARTWSKLSRTSKIAIPVAAITAVTILAVLIYKWVTSASRILKNLKAVTLGHDADAFSKLHTSFVPLTKFEAHMRALNDLRVFLDTIAKSHDLSFDVAKLKQLVSSIEIKYEPITMGSSGWDIGKFHKVVGEVTAELETTMKFVHTLTSAGKQISEATHKLMNASTSTQSNEHDKTSSHVSAIEATREYKAACKRLMTVVHSDSIRVWSVAKKVK